MDRRKFVRQSALATVAVGLMPLAMSGKKRCSVLVLPKEQGHVRHGDWAEPALIAHDDLCEQWTYQRHRFFENGCASSTSDWTYVSLQDERSNLGFHVNANQMVCRSNGQELMLEPMQNRVDAQLDGRTVSLINCSQGAQLQASKDNGLLVIVLEGEVWQGWNAGNHACALVVPAGSSTLLKPSEALLAVVG